MNNKVIHLIAGLVLLGVSFYLGGIWNEFQYDDWCLDMGGGKNPGGYKYCVVGDIIPGHPLYVENETL